MNDVGDEDDDENDGNCNDDSGDIITTPVLWIIRNKRDKECNKLQ